MKYGLGSLLAADALVLSFGYAQADVLTLTSPQIQDNGTLPAKNGASRSVAEQLHLSFAANCVGENVSPALQWSGAPDTTKSFALLLTDPEGRAPLGVTHMIIYGIPADVKGFAEGELGQPSDKFIGGKNLMGVGTYFGPCPPPNTDWHHNTWTLIATDLDPKDPALKPGMTREELAAALGVGTPNSHVKSSAGLVTRFQHP